MKKKLTAYILLLASCAMLAGCASAKADSGEGSTAPAVEERNETDMKYEIVHNKETLPELVIAVMNNYKAVRGYHIFDAKDGYFYLIISSGLKKTGGYRIKVLSVEQKPDSLKVIVEETSPAPDAIVTQALTYPQAVVKFSEFPEKLKVENTKGQELPLIK